MRIFDEYKTPNGDSSYTKEMYECLPDRAKEIFFDVFYRLSITGDTRLFNFGKYWMHDYTQCKSPIEKIFMMTFNFVSILRNDELPSDIMGVFIFPQLDIETAQHKYYVDFYIVMESLNNSVGVVVECDGHEFHQKTKEQVTHDNEREYEIKKVGYDILRFSGSQIYNAPFKCANDVFDYLLSKAERRD